ncbi:MAG: NTP transferase domain-containing protein [Bacteroidetes bacterium]|nr:NTP transferase domain-containing protein [Bacteroidota bacterium]
MRALLFAAGLGTRLKPWTDHHPKALAMVNGKSLLQRNIEYLQQQGIREVIVNVHHFANQIIEAVEKNNGWGSQVFISDESEAVLETGGGLWKARSYFQEQPAFVTMNADILTNLNLSDMIATHQHNKSLITLAVMQRDSSRQLLFDSSLQLKGWRNQLTGEEKGFFLQENNNREALIPLAFSGIAVYDSKIFSLIHETGKFSLTPLFLRLAETEKIMGYDHTGDLLMDLGTEEKLKKASGLFL